MMHIHAVEKVIIQDIQYNGGHMSRSEGFMPQQMMGNMSVDRCYDWLTLEKEHIISGDPPEKSASGIFLGAPFEMKNIGNMFLCD